MKTYLWEGTLLIGLPATRALGVNFLIQQKTPTKEIDSSQRAAMTSLAASARGPASGPKGDGRERRTRRGDIARPLLKRRHRPRRDEEPAFDGKALTAAQVSNEDAKPFDLESALKESSAATSFFSSSMSTLASSPIQCMAHSELRFQKETPQPTFEYCSLDDLFRHPEDGSSSSFGLSDLFNFDSQFREQLRRAIRQDVFDTTPFYANLSEKAASILLLPDSSLEGSWRPMVSGDQRNAERMKRTSLVLKDALGHDNPAVPTGDEFFQAIGGLCGAKPSTHWIDIFGVQDRKINHSWHLDCGQSPENSRTVLLGFPPEDNYVGCGVFSHLVSLCQECWASEDHPRMEPVLFAGSVPEEFIVRPIYEPGKEIIRYRDVDVLHSAPDVTYRTSIMRFM